VLLWTVIVNLGLSAFEFVAGLISGSVALMADALHNTNDAGALLIAYIARKISRKKADAQFTFGYRRAELIGALIQLTALIVVGLCLIYEATHRIFNPEPLQGGWIMAAATVALLVDLVTAWLLWSMSKGSLNVKAAFLHNLTDAAASGAVLLGGAAIHWLNWTWIDPALTLVIASYILWMSWGMLLRTSRILMEGSPEAMDIEALKDAVDAVEGVSSLYNVHVWELDEGRNALEAHILVASHTQIEQINSIKKAIKDLLKERFEIDHSTLEFGTSRSDTKGC